MHVVLRRNRELFHRYLLTRPGELRWRPPHQSPLENLCLAGAWVRNEFALPCVDAAAQGAIKVAGIIAARALAGEKQLAARRFSEAPRSAPLVPPPYRFPRSTGSFFLIDANPQSLAAAISPDLRLFPGFSGRMLFAVLRHEDVHAQHDPSGARYDYNEVMLAAVVREKDLPIGNLGLYPICLYVDDATAMAAGRQIYGFPKKMARIERGAQEISVVHRGVSLEAAFGGVLPITVMKAHWAASPAMRAAPCEPPSDRALMATKPPFPLSLLESLVRRMTFHNTLHSTQPGARPGVNPILSQLTNVALADLKLRRVSALRDFRLRIRPSVDDPLSLLIPPDPHAAEIRAAWGLKMEFGFSMGTAHIVGEVQAVPDAYAPGPAFERTSNWVSARKRTSTATGISELV